MPGGASERQTDALHLRRKKNGVKKQYVTGKVRKQSQTLTTRASAVAKTKMHTPDQLVLRGCLCSGVGQGQYFTRLDWVCRQIQQQFGFDPLPGTFNVVIGPEQRAVLAQVRLQAEEQIIPPEPSNCLANCVAVSVCALLRSEQNQSYSAAYDGVLVTPLLDGYSELLMEIIAPVNLRQALGVRDGDAVEVRIRR